MSIFVEKPERLVLETEKELPMRKENTQENVVLWKTSEGNIYRRKESSCKFA